jgi:hypothetical protein
MPERQGRRVFLVCLICMLGTPIGAEPPEMSGTSKRDIEKKREALPESTTPPRSDKLESDTARKREAEISLRILDQTESGWSVAQTDHFCVYHTQTEAAARKICIAAERARGVAARKWFDDPCDWSERCEIFVYETARGYSQASGAPIQSPGHSEIRAEGSRVLLRRIFVHADDPGMIKAVLPHEVTHTVLAGRFGDYQVPRWADEGMAVLDEPQERINRHLRMLAHHRTEGDLFSARQLICLKDYPEARRVPVFYAESVSLTEFLTQAKGPRTLARFVRDGLRDGYEAALKRHYGWDFDELERRWHQHAFAE